jgi:hypothetical protein
VLEQCTPTRHWHTFAPVVELTLKEPQPLQVAAEGGKSQASTIGHHEGVGQQEPNKVPQIASSYTVVDPATVMIMARDAGIAELAVSAPCRAQEFAGPALPLPGQMLVWGVHLAPQVVIAAGDPAWIGVPGGQPGDDAWEHRHGPHHPAQTYDTAQASRRDSR